MKKVLSILAIAVLIMSNAAVCNAGPTETVNVTVTIEQSVSIEVTGGPIGFGTLGVSDTAVSSSAMAVRNDGSGIGETITLAVVNPTGWTQGVPGEETYRISFQFAETQPLADDPGWQNEGGISELLSYDETKNLWVKLETPTATGATAEQTAQVTITAAG